MPSTKHHNIKQGSNENKVIYLDPERYLSKEDIHKYYDKIKVFKSFVQKVLCIGNSMSLEYELYKWRDINEEEYQKWNSDSSRNSKYFYVGKQSPCTDQESYMYSFKQEDPDNLDELDKKFIETQTSDKKIEFYGLHTYGGCYAFFRPDFLEVIHMLNTVLPITELESIKRIYITTEPHPNDINDFCFDYSKDKHRAKTTCYIFNCDDEHANVKRINKKQKLDQIIN